MAISRVCMVAITMATIFELAMGTYYIVGDTKNWNLNVDYTTWVAGKTFHPNDQLGFLYSSSAHDVLEVSSNDYTQCINTNPITKDASGNTTITLQDVGTRYFICGIGNHCADGMKVQIDVVAASGPGSSPSPPPPPPSAADSLSMAVKSVLAFVFTAYVVLVVL